jgi:hypothetical protein
MRLKRLTASMQIIALAILVGSGVTAASAQGPCMGGHPYNGHFGYIGGPPCFGYYSTCWRPWPADCCPCPSFAERLPLPEHELVPEPIPRAWPNPASARPEVPSELTPELTVPPPLPDDASNRKESAPSAAVKSRSARSIKSVGYRR